jgi:nicotinamidase-related amidase
MTPSKALIIIDVQVALFEDDSPLYKAKNLLISIQGLIKEAREKSIPIIYIQHTEDQGDFAKDTSTWAIHPAIKPCNQDTVVEKRSWDVFFNTDLKKILNEKHIKELIIVGMQTEFCLDTTIRNGYSHGYKLTVCGDVHTTYDNGRLKASDIIKHHNMIWHNRFAQVVSSKDFTF